MIPKVIHCIWFSGDEKPDNFKKCMATWPKVLPDYQIKEWSLKDVEEIRKVPENKFLDQALNNKKWSWAADFLRLWILYNEGGIYLDCDVEVLKSFDPFLDNGFFTCYETFKAVEAAVMGAEKGNKFAKEFLDLYLNKDFLNARGEIAVDVIPIVLADYILAKYKKYKAKRRHTVIDTLHIYPYQYFSPKDYHDCNQKVYSNKNTHAIHRFAGSWTSETISKKISLRKRFINKLAIFAHNMLSYKADRKVTKFVQKVKTKRKAKAKQ